MAGIVKIDITETPSELKTLLSQQKTSQNFARVQALYLLKTGQVKTVIGLSIILGKNRVTFSFMVENLPSSGDVRLIS